MQAPVWGLLLWLLYVIVESQAESGSPKQEDPTQCSLSPCGVAMANVLIVTLLPYRVYVERLEFLPSLLSWDPRSDPYSAAQLWHSN